MDRVGYSPWGHKELDMTEQLSTFLFSLLLGISEKILLQFMLEDSACFLPRGL